MTPERIKELRRDLEKARGALKELCETGGKSFRMCVPVEGGDTDIVLANAIDSGFECLNEIERLQQFGHSRECVEQGMFGGFGPCICSREVPR